MMLRQIGQASTRPRRGSVETKFTRVRSSRMTLTVLIVSLQLGHVAVYSSVYSASLSRRTSSAASAAATGFTASSAILGSFGTGGRPHYAGGGVRNRAVR
jgi:hypothetical protein